jgi:hypothetical protein
MNAGGGAWSEIGISLLSDKPKPSALVSLLVGGPRRHGDSRTRFHTIRAQPDPGTLLNRCRLHKRKTHTCTYTIFIYYKDILYIPCSPFPFHPQECVCVYY